MEIVEQVTRDRANLVDGLQKMQAQHEEMGRRVQQQAGAIQYCDVLLERIKGEENRAAPVVEAAPVEGAGDVG